MDWSNYSNPCPNWFPKTVELPPVCARSPKRKPSPAMGVKGPAAPTHHTPENPPTFKSYPKCFNPYLLGGGRLP